MRRVFPWPHGALFRGPRSGRMRRVGVRFLEGRDFYRLTVDRAGGQLLPFYGLSRTSTFTGTALLHGFTHTWLFRGHVTEI